MTYQLVFSAFGRDAVMQTGTYDQVVQEFDQQLRVARRVGHTVNTYPTEGTVRAADLLESGTLQLLCVLTVSRDPAETKCQFCGDTARPLDRYGNCKPCVDGMARTNGD